MDIIPQGIWQYLIDDAALGAPLVTDVDDKYIDWKMAAAHLYYAGLLSENDITELFGDRIAMSHLSPLSSKFS